MPSSGDVSTGGGHRRSAGAGQPPRQRGCHHGVPSQPSPRRARAAVRWPAGTTGSQVRLGTPVQCGEGALCSSAGRAETHRLGKGVLGSRGLSVLVLVADGGGQGLGPPAASVALRCCQQWEPGEPPSQGARERQSFLQAPSFAVITAGVPALCKTSTQNCSGG